MISTQATSVIFIICFAQSVSSFTPLCTSSSRLQSTLSSPSGSPTGLQMGIFDDLKLIFSDEGKKNREEYERREREQQEAAQREIMERRRNPNKMAEYEQDVRSRRKNLQEDQELWSFQQEVGGDDPLNTWTQLKAEGKIKSSSDIERDPTSSRLGSEGLQEIRTDDKLPYIDQGYVDESADVLGNFKNMFGGKKKKEEESE